MSAVESTTLANPENWGETVNESLPWEFHPRNSPFEGLGFWERTTALVTTGVVNSSRCWVPPKNHRRSRRIGPPRVPAIGKLSLGATSGSKKSPFSEKSDEV